MNKTLTFIIGEPGSGKSHLMTGQIRSDAENNIPVIVIVPEQYSSTAEHKLYNALGIQLYNRIKVETFSRIKRSIALKNGGLSAPLPDEAAKAAAMYTVRKELANAELKCYRSQIKNPAFTSMCIKMARELELNGISPEMLRTDNIGDSALSDKMQDISFICESYNARLIECGYRNALSDGREIAEAAAATDFFKDTKVYIDQFRSFTADELELMDIIKTQTQLTVCLPTPYKAPNDSPVFSLVNETMSRIAKDDEPCFIIADSDNDRFSAAPDIRCLSRSILRGETLPKIKAEHIHTAEASNTIEEAEFVCAEISRLVRSGKYKYKDIAILSRDFSGVCAPLENAFRMYDIPYFIDDPRSVSSKPLFIYVMTVLEIASKRSPSSQMLFRLMKTFFSGVYEQHISELEQYYTEHNIRNDSWTESPLGTDTAITYEELCGYDYSLSPKDEPLHKVLDPADRKNHPLRCEIIRGAVMKPLSQLRNSCSGTNTLSFITERLCEFLNNADISKKAAAVSDDPESREAKEAYQLLNILERTLRSVSAITLPENADSFSIKEYRELFGIIISGTKISSPAHSANCVTASASERARLDSPKLVFIMSAVSGMFPYKVKESGIFTEHELEMIESSTELTFAARITRLAAEEAFIAVSAAAAPSHELYITWSLADTGGKARYIAPLTDNIIEMIQTRPVIVSALPAEYFITTAESAYSVYVRTLGKNGALSPEKTAAVKAVYGSSIGTRMELADNYSRDIASGNIYRKQITSDNALKIYTGRNGDLNISASRIEDYAKCPFMFFCKSGLKLSSVKKLEFASNTRGTAVHFILSGIMNEIYDEAEKNKLSFNECFSRKTDKYLKDRIILLLNEYYRNQFISEGFLPDNIFKHSMDNQCEDLFEIIIRMRSEFAPSNSKFAPDAFEFSIGGYHGKSDMQPWKLKGITDDGKEFDISFSGSVDRIDVFTDESSGTPIKYLRVVDYKTGAKEFKLKDLVNGINMQMILYLSAVTDTETDSIYSGYNSAGFMYMPAHRAKSEALKDNRFKGDSSAHLQKILDSELSLKGISSANINIIRAMEYLAEGKFIKPKLNIQNYISKNYSENELIEKIFRDFDKYFPEDTDNEIRNRLTELLTAVPAKNKTKCPDPSYTFTDKEFKNVRKFVTDKLISLSSEICSGKADISPLSTEKPCQFCDYRSICENSSDDAKLLRSSANNSAEITDNIRAFGEAYPKPSAADDNETEEDDLK
ncbi:MAG: PD-(D/E)XK nuclease family protein [Oscillospiraceae bacterium]|nr:PD-(D/E)XK nuclease family protein [Oscillospiraceae bacterium]